MSDRGPPGERAPEPAPERGVDPPPFLRSWANLYALELLALLAVILALAWLTRSFE